MASRAATRAGRSPPTSGAATTISREVHRNGGRERYRAQAADASTWKRARRPEAAKLATNALLRAVVEQKLVLRWSPQQISAWLGRAYPDCEAMGISHEPIYLSLFVQSRGTLRRELTAHLRSGHTTRRPRGRPMACGRGQITTAPAASTSAIRAGRGSAAATRTPTACCASTSPESPVSPSTQERLDAVAAALNGRPRKTLGWMTPAEKLAELTTAV